MPIRGNKKHAKKKAPVFNTLGKTPMKKASFNLLEVESEVEEALKKVIGRADLMIRSRAFKPGSPEEIIVLTCVWPQEGEGFQKKDLEISSSYGRAKIVRVAAEFFTEVLKKRGFVCPAKS